jgi:hypothetical protein
MKHPEQQTGDFESAAIRRLIDVRLKARLRHKTLSDSSVTHPDDDVVNAFVEGRLEDAESLFVISHLVSCTSCLHLTAQLVRLEPEMGEVGSTSLPDEQPGPLQRFFDRLAPNVNPSIGEDVVFAYEEKDESATSEDPKSKPNSPKSETESL